MSSPKSHNMCNMRVGFGYDIHPLIAGGEGLWIGGIQIPCNKKAQAHSDGDTLIHAICDALLGASALGDIGHHFPDSDPQWHNASSSRFIHQILKLITKNSFQIINIDTTILLQEPLLGDYKQQIAANLADLLALPLDSVSVKATRGEGLDSVGRGKAIASQCVCLLEKKAT